MSKRENSLTEGPLISSVLLFTIPFLLSNLLQTLYGTVDTLVIGNFGSTAGVSAVATGAQALTLVTYFALGLSGGSTVLIGRCIGAKHNEDAARLVGNTIIGFGALSIVLTALMLLTYPYILTLLNIPEEAVTEAHRYMFVCSLGIPLIIGYNLVCAVLRAIGDSRSPLLFVTLACIVNVIGDLLLTAVFHMGALGVAIATVTAQGVSFVFSLVFIMKKGLPFAFSRKDVRADRFTLGSIARVGFPMGVQSVLVNLSFLFITAIINSMGLTASAAMGIGEKISGFAFMPQSAFSAALAVIVSQNIGAQKPKRGLDALKISILISVSIETVFCLLCQFQAQLFPGLFTHDSAVIELAGLYLRAYSLDAVLTAVTFCISGLLNGYGWTMFNMLQNLGTTFLVRVPVTWLMSRVPNTTLFLIGLAAPASTLVTLVLEIALLWLRRKKLMNPLQ